MHIKNKILIIEDDKEICDMVDEFLTRNNYETITCYDGHQGLNLIKTCAPDLIILDIMLPYKSGDEVLRELRNFSEIPVMIISAKEMIQTKVDLFKLGADDYLTKPFDLNELLVRLEAVLKRYNKSVFEQQFLNVHEIRMDLNVKQVFVNDQPIILTPKEFQLLEKLMLNPNKVFSKQNLYESVWSEPYHYDDNAINTHISNIRKKLKTHSNVEYIKTVWGMGYKLN